MFTGNPVCTVPIALTDFPITEQSPDHAGRAQVPFFRHPVGARRPSNQLNTRRTSKSLLALLQERQKEFCEVSGSPPPMLPPLIRATTCSCLKAESRYEIREIGSAASPQTCCCRRRQAMKRRGTPDKAQCSLAGSRDSVVVRTSVPLLLR